MSRAMEARVGNPDQAEATRIRREALELIARLEKQATEVEEATKASWKIMMLFPLVVMAEFALMYPKGLLLWVVSALVVYSFNFILLFLPTTRAARGRSRSGRPKTRRMTFAISLAARRRLLTQTLLRTFLLNSVPFAPAFIAIFSLCIAIALDSLILGALTDILAAIAVVAQAAAIIAYYSWLVRFRPYSPQYTREIIEKGREVVDQFRSKAAEGLRNGLILLAFLAFIAAILVTAILLPGLTLRRVEDLLNLTFGTSILSLALIVATQGLIMRYTQMVASGRLGREFLRRTVQLVRAEVLTPLDAVEKGEVMEIDSALERIGTSLSSFQVYKLVRHDLNGLLPVYLVVPDIRLIGEKSDIDVQLAHAAL